MRIVMKNGQREDPRSVVGNLYTPSERPGGNPIRRSFALVLTATILTAALVFLAVGYLSVYARAGKNEQLRARLMQRIAEREARVNGLHAMVDAERVRLTYCQGEESQPLTQAAERTDYINASSTTSHNARQPSKAAWLVKSKARIASVISSYTAAALRPAAAEPAPRLANRERNSR